MKGVCVETKWLLDRNTHVTFIWRIRCCCYRNVCKFTARSTQCIETVWGVILLSAKVNTDGTSMITGSVERRERKQEGAGVNW